MANKAKFEYHIISSETSKEIEVQCRLLAQYEELVKATKSRIRKLHHKMLDECIEQEKIWANNKEEQ